MWRPVAVTTSEPLAFSVVNPMAQMPRLRLTRREVRSGGPGDPGGGAGAGSGAERGSRSVGVVRQL